MGERFEKEVEELRFVESLASVPQPKKLSDMDLEELHSELRRLEARPWARGAAAIDARQLRGAEIQWHIAHKEGRNPGPYPTLGPM